MKVSVRDFKAKLSSYLDRIERGESFEVRGIKIGKVGVSNYTLDELIDACVKCRKVEATRIHWEDGEEYRVCEGCWNKAHNIKKKK